MNSYANERSKAQYGFVKLMTSDMRRAERPAQYSSKPAVVCLDTDLWMDVMADVAREGAELIGIATTGLAENDMMFRLLNCSTGVIRHLPGDVERVPVHPNSQVKMVLTLIDQAIATGRSVTVEPADEHDAIDSLDVESVEFARL